MSFEHLLLPKRIAQNFSSTKSLRQKDAAKKRSNRFNLLYGSNEMESRVIDDFSGSKTAFTFHNFMKRLEEKTWSTLSGAFRESSCSESDADGAKRGRYKDREY